MTGAVRGLPFTPLYVLLALCNTVIVYFLLMLWQGGRVCAESDITSTVRCGVDWPRLRRIRTMRGWTQARLAEQSGLLQHTISQIESGAQKGECMQLATATFHRI